MNRDVVIAMAMLIGGLSSAKGQALAPVADPLSQGQADELDSFAGFRVVPSPRHLDPYDTASRVSGALIQIKTRGDGALEPYFLWNAGKILTTCAAVRATATY